MKIMNSETKFHDLQGAVFSLNSFISLAEHGCDFTNQQGKAYIEKARSALRYLESNLDSQPHPEHTTFLRTLLFKK